MPQIKVVICIVFSILLSNPNKLWDLGVSIESKPKEEESAKIYGYKTPSLQKSTESNLEKKTHQVSYTYKDYTDHQIQEMLLREQYDLLVYHFSFKKKGKKLSDNEMFYYLNALFKIKKIDTHQKMIKDLSNAKPSYIYLKILIFEYLNNHTKADEYSKLLSIKYPNSDYTKIIKQFNHLIYFKM